MSDTPYQPISAVSPSGVWQPAGKRRWELVTPDGVAAGLHWPRFLSNLALAEAADGAWSFKRAGLTGSRVTVREQQWDHNLAEMALRWNRKGQLEFVGRRFRWAPSNFWSTRWHWLADDDAPLVRFRRRSGLRSRGEVEVTTDGHRYPELPILLTLGWYLMAEAQKDTVAAAG